jgi:hypothetical protein
MTVGAGAGIGVGCTAAVAGIAVLAWLFLHERRKRKALEAQSRQFHSAAAYENQTAGKKGTSGLAETDVNAMLELQRTRVEMIQDHMRHETGQQEADA